MEEKNKHPFRLRLNLFDALILVLAVGVGAFLAWNALKPVDPVKTPTTSAVQYTVRFQKMKEGTSGLVQPGDQLVDTIKNYAIGTVVSVETVPAEYQGLNMDQKKYVLTTMEGYEDAIVTVESPATENSSALVLDGGYELRAGAMVYLRGPGYMASGPVLTIHREVG